MRKSPVILICAYRRTGKDTFFLILTSRKNEGLFKWRIYTSRTDTNHTFTRDLYKHTSFAKKLKLEASDVYGIPEIISDDDKDIKQFIHHKTGKLVSARDIYIEWGKIRRAEDLEYWCKAAFEVDDDDAAFVVTDWRFENEVNYTRETFAQVDTIRLYRSDVPEPDLSIESEHNLDHHKTDFLLIRDDMEGEFERAVERFPQYSDYVVVGTI